MCGCEMMICDHLVVDAALCLVLGMFIGFNFAKGLGRAFS